MRTFKCYRVVKARITAVEPSTLHVEPTHLYGPFSASCTTQEAQELSTDVGALFVFTMKVLVDADTEEVVTAHLMSFRKVGNATAEDWRTWGTAVRRLT